MNRFISLLCGSMLAVAGCGGSSSNQPAGDAATTGDATADTGGGNCPTPGMPGTTTGGCYTENGSVPLCPATAVAQSNAMQPTFRITHIKITAPQALTSAILLNTVNDAIHRGGFLWGVTFDLTGNMVRTGALNTMNITRGMVGQGLLDGTFRYYADNAPAMGGAANRWNPVSTGITVTNSRATTMNLMGTVRLPIFDTSGALLTELPLENASMSDVLLACDRRCIGAGQLSGGRFNECTSNWQTADLTSMMPYGRLSAVITVAAARMVRVSALNTTLCNLLAGSDCDAMPMAMWTRQPDTMSGGMPGYQLTTEFAAVSARIQ